MYVKALSGKTSYFCWFVFAFFLGLCLFSCGFCFLQVFPAKSISVLLETGSVCSVLDLSFCFWCHPCPKHLCPRVTLRNICLFPTQPISAHIIVRSGGQVECAPVLVRIVWISKQDPASHAFSWMWLGSLVPCDCWLMHFHFSYKENDLLGNFWFWFSLGLRELRTDIFGLECYK